MKFLFVTRELARRHAMKKAAELLRVTKLDDDFWTEVIDAALEAIPEPERDETAWRAEESRQCKQYDLLIQQLFVMKLELSNAICAAARDIDPRAFLRKFMRDYANKYGEKC